MRVLVTGSSGQIGTNLVLRLQCDGHDVIGEPITVYGGETKTLDFTYVDDCVDGVVRGLEALVDGKVVNETVNLAFGQGNTLVRVAELIAAELDVRPQISVAPSLVGEVTRYVADVTKARHLLGWEPAVPLDDGIARAASWFREHRLAHPEEDAPVPPEETRPGDAELGWKTEASAHPTAPGIQHSG